MTTWTGVQAGARLATLPALALLAMLTGCDSQQQVVGQKEDNLAAAGFIVTPANTPSRQAMLSRLPAGKFVQRVQGSTVSYVYADPLVCDCLYVGDQTAFAKYQQYVQAKRIADEQQLTASLYSDPAWNWGGWGYGGFGPGF